VSDGVINGVSNGSSGVTIEQAAKVARTHADDADAARRLAPATVEALADAGAFTLCLPVAYGGAGGGPVVMIDAVAELAAADASAGWCAGIASTTSSLAAFLDPEVARVMFPTPRAATGGVFAPNGRGVVTADGVSVSGRWQWGSGTQHCEWIVGGARCDDGTQRTCVFPRNAVEFHDTWHVGGMRGTGSLDFEVTDAVVPDSWTIRVGDDRPTVDEPIARFPNMTLLALGIAATGLGNARRALDELRELAVAKTPQFSSRTLSQSGFAQTEFARAETRWRAARALLRAEVAAAWDAAVAGRPVDVEARVGMRLAASHAASECVAVARTAYELAGGTAVYDTSALGRCMRDAHVVTQHIMVAPKLNETLGKHLLGAEFDARMI
jgi:alkylation response protein AidB-like acyl-CoA dehydrogenase